MNSFHASYNHQNMNSRCIWQRWNIWANTINCMTKLTNNIIPFADASKNQETFHFLLVLAVKLVTMNEEKRWTLTEVWSLKSTFSLIVVLFLFFFSFKRGEEDVSSVCWDLFVPERNICLQILHLQYISAAKKKSHVSYHAVTIH